MTPLQLHAHVETWPIAGEFVIARGAKREAIVVVATVGDGVCSGRGECVPYGRYGETPESVLAAIEATRGAITTRAALARQMPPGAARNALDCALWDYEAKRTGVRASTLAGLADLKPLVTAFTISLGTPDAMAKDAAAAAARAMPLLKLKLGGASDAERMRAVRAACPAVRMIADANESWTPALLPPLMQIAAETGMELIEQPLPAGEDTALANVRHAVPICADESCHSSADLEGLNGRYEAINIKLDKAGGLTEALDLAAEARARGFKIMVGCMVSTSLAMAPAMLVAQAADWIDLDGPLLLAEDRRPTLRYEGATVYPPEMGLWG